MNYFHFRLQKPRTCKLFNAVAVAKNGDLYFTHSSSEYGIHRAPHVGFINPSGRLIHYSRSTGKLTVLIDKIWFANGVALSPAQDFAVVCEAFSARLIKFWLTGASRGQSEIFVDGLPGGPDNLAVDKDGVWVALADEADETHPTIYHISANYPLIRKFEVRLVELFMMSFEFVNSVYPNRFTDFICREFGSIDLIFKLITVKRRTVINLDWEGNIKRAYHGTDQSTGIITHAMKLDGFLYLGSVTTDYIARVRIGD